MLNTIEKVNRSSGQKKYTILIPSWNNLPYLQLCLRSLKQHSAFEHQIVVLLNESRDSSLEWIKSQKDIDYVYSPQNVGICYGLNLCRSLVKTEYLVYFNDDMYALPDWDRHLENVRKQIEPSRYLLSATMIEPTDTGNPCVIVQDYGEDLESFGEEHLLASFTQHDKIDWSGSTWPPILMPLELWDMVGGMSIEYHPGMYSDPDLSMKLWQAGTRYFRGVAQSRVYHFGSKSTGRVRHNKGREAFLSKWGITPNFFTQKFLKRGQQFQGLLPDYQLSLKDQLVNFMKGGRGYI